MKNKKSYLILCLMMSLVLFTGCGKEEKGYYEATSKFERSDNGYTLKGASGEIIMTDISNHGDFCNGTAMIENADGQYAIIDDKGKVIVGFGKYKYITQEACFYEVKDESMKTSILKYNGEVLISDNNDKYLKKVDIYTYYDTNRYVLLETEKNYKVLNY